MFFHKLKITDNIPLKLPELVLNNKNIKREYSMKFLWVATIRRLPYLEKSHTNDRKENLKKCWHFIQIKIFIKPKKSNKYLLFIYSCIYIYINYANIAWSSTNPSKLKKILNKQKHASRIILSEERNTHSRPLMKKLGILNIFQLNILQTLLFMFKTKNEESPRIFSDQFSNIQTLNTNIQQDSLITISNIEHKYSTRFSDNNFKH